MKESFKYEQAMKELEDIVRKMENDQLDIDSMTQQLKKAKTLIADCKQRLVDTEQEIKKILDEKD